jgi:hypothetical protein
MAKMVQLVTLAVKDRLVPASASRDQWASWMTCLVAVMQWEMPTWSQHLGICMSGTVQPGVILGQSWDTLVVQALLDTLAVEESQDMLDHGDMLAVEEMQVQSEPLASAAIQAVKDMQAAEATTAA